MSPRWWRRLAALAPLVVGAVHCHKIHFDSSAAPNNDCNEHPCRAFQGATATCNEMGEYCQVNATFAFDLVIATAAGSPPYFGARTTLIHSSALSQPVTDPGCPTGQACVYVPLLASSVASYDVDSAAAAKVGREVGNPGLITSLPMHAVFYPLAPTSDATTLLATDLSYPLLPTLAPLILDLTLGLPAGAHPGPGPFGAPPIVWSVSLPSGRYLRVIMPDPPFNDAFPPREDVVKLETNTVDTVLLTTNELDKDLESRRFKISPDPTGPRDLTGFTAVLQDRVSHRNISRVATLASGTNDVTLFTTHHEVLTNVPVELVVAPPPGTEGVPTLVSRATPVIPHTQVYPVVGAPVTFSGLVTGSGDLGSPLSVRATVILQSEDDDAAIPSNANVPLRYATKVQTDESGRFAVKVPLGHYDMAILPDNPSVSETATRPALWVGKVTVDGAMQRTFPLSRQATIGGVVALADGTPLAEADVEADAAVEPEDLPAGSQPPFPFPPFARAVRPGLAHTDASGAFSIPLDPGYYDIFVRPKDKTRFPWVVSTSHKIGSSPVTLDSLVVPAPIAVSITLLQTPTPQQNALGVREALVRAFAVPQGKSAAVEIGRALTNADGKLELFLAGPPN